MQTVEVEFEGSNAEGSGADLDEAIERSLLQLSQLRGKRELFVPARLKGQPEPWEKLVEIKYQADHGRGTLYARDLVEHYHGAIATVGAVASLPYGFAGRTKNAIEEVISYAILSAKSLQHFGWREIDVRADLLRTLSPTAWAKNIDVDKMLLKSSAA
ncbi:hypothetical protein HGP17_24050 [Rhizobium sp. P38BS-XIX]|uniref:hypothetical protein n=1 Tax=Rhizobium sp. P38BS-XIX TaxID=2726740 RepID=UPI00145734C3|nr:hypothetical protein [Rhizobium sp. P38BS-XIX]NLR99907.1 hypothetical protein [Rhizobium sp. P38BS-XIX]